MDKYIESLIAGILVGILCGTLGYYLIDGDMGGDNWIEINQETADTLCQKITMNDTAIAKDWWDFYNSKPIEKGQIVCELPSYDHTQNIVVKTKG